MKKTFKRKRKYGSTNNNKGGYRKDTKKLLLKAKRFLKKKDLDNAAITFEKAFKANSHNAEATSYYGLCSALRWGKTGYGIELCTKAIKANTINPEFYLNLAKVYVHAGNKVTAATVLRKALAVAPSNKHINNMLYEIGARKRPFIPFLKWSNPVNRTIDLFFKNTLPAIFKKRMPLKLKKKLEAEAAKA